MPESSAIRDSQSVLPSFTFTGKGLTSRRDVTVDVSQAPPGTGINFVVRSQKEESVWVTIPARSRYAVNTLRNVTLGHEGTRLCIVEHFLAAASLLGMHDLTCRVDGQEMPLGDGSANFWVSLFENAAFVRSPVVADVDLGAPVYLNKKDRSLIAVPDERFSVSYMMDWNHPLIGKRWATWDSTMPVEDLCNARTFGSLKEHQMLGLDKDVVSLTADGFTEELRFPDEPVRHKLLDLIGDLTLCGINPLRIKARFISIKGGHELDVELTNKMSALLEGVST